MAFDVQRNAAKQPFTVFHDVRAQDAAFSLGSPASSCRDQLRQPTIRRAIGCIQQDRWLGVRNDLCSDQDFQLRFFGGDMCPNHPGQSISISDAQSPIVQLFRPSDQFVRVGCSFQERIVRLTSQLSVGNSIPLRTVRPDRLCRWAFWSTWRLFGHKRCKLFGHRKRNGEQPRRMAKTWVGFSNRRKVQKREIARDFSI